ncbi:multidrug efflux RND transporter permease subunit [Thalassotalea sp. HSM 43]|uniref:efflux RND transporter permease subunit n=1 Tax=Thalassotalea sp. HSM 43 TaxID=2552945 RepID=UPI001081B264|nr:multidrug efflux RND transporter permease subunit [Thalassotalea sp. HSM 43]QBY03954.1 multidrug efflux RND transporter permease subunit [Thalassotalea sp. HSM 43]
MIEFFINRPKFAMVLSIVMTLAGFLTLAKMPVSLYPSVSPPTILITANFPGADHNTIRDTVASVLEQEINGVEDMIYMDTKSANDGTYIGRVTFDIGTDPDRAQSLVQNRVNKAMPKLPGIVSQLGVTVQKSSPSMLVSVSLYSPNDTYDDVFLSNYMTLNIMDQLLRVQGVGELKLLGQKDYSMRVWIDNEKMAGFGIDHTEVSNAVAAQNATISAGKIGESPNPEGTTFQYTIKTKGRLQNVEEFEEIVVRVMDDGSDIRLKDIARIEMGSKAYYAQASWSDKPSPLLIAYQGPGANAIQVANEVKAKMAEMSESFPEDVEYDIAFDSTTFITASMDEVYKTLFEALFLVAIITYLFLQNWRATIIPLIAIPVSLVATFLVFQAMGIDINTISMFGLILAIGIVVDAAIVVIENVERLMHEEHLPSKEATSKAMKEVTAPLIASALVLMAVFVPVSLAPGMVGILYAQFGVAIVASTVLSTVVALTLTPALCAILMEVKPLATKGPLGWFNKFVDGLRNQYGSLVNFLGRRLWLTMTVFAVLIAYIGYLGKTMPTGFIPEEDKGNFIVDVSLPEASTLERTIEQVNEMTRQIEDIPGVARVVSASGFSMLKGALATNSAMLIVSLDDWSERKEPELSIQSILMQTRGVLANNREIKGLALTTPAIPGMGNASGLSIVLQDTLGRSTESLAPVLQKFSMELMARPEIAYAFSTYTANVPQLYLDIDYQRAMKLGIEPTAINSTLSTMFGKKYVNDFTKFGKNYQVNIMSDGEFRDDETDLNTLYVTNKRGELIRFASFADFKPAIGADVSARYNLYNSTQLMAAAAPGYSSGDAIKAVQEVADSLPDGYKIDWTGQTYQEIKTGGGIIFLFGLAVLFTYLFLVAQYESWLTPFAIMLCVPTALFGALFLVHMMGGTLNIYTQIGLVLMIGMAARNAILIVEFAKVLREERGFTILNSAIEAAKLRMRAVLMTAFAFILGVIPLMIASGAGSASRNVMGQTVFGGMLSATIIGCIFVPVFYLMFQRLRERFGATTEQAEKADAERLVKGESNV